MKNEPLGLPKGSVRAILVIAVVAFAGIGIFNGNESVATRSFDLLKMLIPLYIGVQLPSGRDNKGE
jgi:hypothetical protein